MSEGAQQLETAGDEDEGGDFVLAVLEYIIGDAERDD